MHLYNEVQSAFYAQFQYWLFSTDLVQELPENQLTDSYIPIAAFPYTNLDKRLLRLFHSQSQQNLHRHHHPL
ncbi:hypothetical protein D3C80_1055270 [compost metagenome]